MAEKVWNRNFFIYSDVTIIGSTVYNSILTSKIPIAIIKEIYERKN